MRDPREPIHSVHNILLRRFSRVKRICNYYYYYLLESCFNVYLLYYVVITVINTLIIIAVVIILFSPDSLIIISCDCAPLYFSMHMFER